jgi:hypothetical protein
MNYSASFQFLNHNFVKNDDLKQFVVAQLVDIMAFWLFGIEADLDFSLKTVDKILAECILVVLLHYFYLLIPSV